MKKRFIPVAEPLIGPKEKKYVLDCLETGWVSSAGKYVGLFEKEFAQFCRAEHGVAVNSGTASLHLALLAIGVKPGDEVIVPALTFVSTANTVSYCQAKPVFVDVDPQTLTIDPEKIKAAITKKTRAIIPVHLWGHPADMKPIISLAKKYRLKVIEDAAEAHGALCYNKTVGAIGDISCFSFFANKIITTGEGGMLVTKSKKLADTARMLRDTGATNSQRHRYFHSRLGFNYAMSNLQAALGLGQLKSIRKFIKKKKSNAKSYQRLLKGIDGLTLPYQAPWAQSVFWMFTILVKKDFSLSRPQLVKRLAAAGIETRPFFVPLHLLPFYRTGQKLPVAEKISRQGLCLPSSTKLTQEDIKYICQTIKLCAK